MFFHFSSTHFQQNVVIISKWSQIFLYFAQILSTKSRISITKCTNKFHYGAMCASIWYSPISIRFEQFDITFALSSPPPLPSTFFSSFSLSHSLTPMLTIHRIALWRSELQPTGCAFIRSQFMPMPYTRLWVWCDACVCLLLCFALLCFDRIHETQMCWHSRVRWQTYARKPKITAARSTFIPMWFVTTNFIQSECAPTHSLST